ncbi:hypothetical protein [Marinomonas transparens]|uniref:Oxidoreductase molybdopterin binding domain protein n=1 Tax=Marinomonas transparens TaxID=2795388 RepID=A0A934MYG2_9GAMM|nr:hypothetical protein [Marinomonas transparens]MBJ7536425.1 hypothetical protein [Marinomonas transparens]
MRLFFSLICVLLINTPSYALDQPSGRVILTISNALDDANAEHGIEFDLDMLNALPQRSVTTHNPWTKGSHTYRGFSAKDLLATIESKATLLKVIALNQYMTEIPISDFTERGAIFATHLDGHPMSVRKLGPIMVIYPFDDQPELKSETYYGRSIWQIHRIETYFIAE